MIIVYKASTLLQGRLKAQECLANTKWMPFVYVCGAGELLFDLEIFCLTWFFFPLVLCFDLCLFYVLKEKENEGGRT